jgi:hypothetical protein
MPKISVQIFKGEIEEYMGQHICGVFLQKELWELLIQKDHIHFVLAILLFPMN